MKKLILIPALLFVLALNLTSCDTGGSSSSTFDPQTLINTAKKKTWRVQSYIESGIDETSHFTAYNFTFADANAVTATNGTNTYTGTWSVTRVINQDEQTQELYFNLGFTAPADFIDLTKNWYVTSYSTSMIYLLPSNGSTGNVLILARN